MILPLQLSSFPANLCRCIDCNLPSNVFAIYIFCWVNTRSNRSRIFSGLFRKFSGPPGSVVLSYRNGRGFEYSTPFSRISERHLRLLTGKTGVVIRCSFHWKAFQFTAFLGTFFSSSPCRYLDCFTTLYLYPASPIDLFLTFLAIFSFSLMGSNLIGRERGVCALAMIGAGSWEGVGIEWDWIGNWQVG